jgi:hypothetical protein
MTNLLQGNAYDYELWESDDLGNSRGADEESEPSSVRNHYAAWTWLCQPEALEQWPSHRAAPRAASVLPDLLIADAILFCPIRSEPVIIVKIDESSSNKCLGLWYFPED